MKRMALILIVLLAFAGANSFAKTYSLEQCIQHAKQTDPNLARFRNNVKTSGANVLNQMGQFLPSLTFELSYIKSDHSESTSGIDLRGRVVDTIQPAYTSRMYNTDLRLDYTLFDGLQNIWNYLGSKASKRAASENVIVTESDLVYAVKGSYYLVLKNKRDVTVAEETVKRSEELLKLFQEKYDLGSASRSEVLKQKVQYGRDKLTLVRAKNAYKLAKYQLAITIGLNPQEDFDIENIEIVKKESLPSQTELVREAVAAHPSILAAEAELSASRYDIRSAYGQYLPRLNLKFTYNWQKNKFNDALKFDAYDRTATTYLIFRYNIFDGFTRERNLSRAKVAVNNANFSSVYTQNKVIKNIKDAYLGVKLAEEALSVTEEVEKSASEDFDLVQTKYNLGAAALWELLDSQVSLKSAKFERVKAEFDYNLALAKLQNAMGR